MIVGKAAAMAVPAILEHFLADVINLPFFVM
jgi:hypothetical protein